MTQPQIVDYRTIDPNTSALVDGHWIPARPMAYQYSFLRSVKNRIILAAGVFSGRYDAFDWTPKKLK